ncbi:MAG TPA: hypothetical protein VFZ41_10265 [Solirubrobacterales bacterium]
MLGDVGIPARPGAGRATAAVDLYWLPLGAGGHFVRLNGRIYEALGREWHGVHPAISTTPRSRSRSQTGGS